jgi:hypothetical protein
VSHCAVSLRNVQFVETALTDSRFLTISFRTYTEQAPHVHLGTTSVIIVTVIIVRTRFYKLYIS